MIAIESTVNVNLSGLRKFGATIEAGLRSTSASNPIRKAITQWAVRYRAFARKRFVGASRGDGTWKPLKPSTIAARVNKPIARARAFNRQKDAAFRAKHPSPTAKQLETHTRGLKRRLDGARSRVAKATERIRGGAREAAILRDTGTLFNAFAPELGRPGQLSQHVPMGIRVGYGGPAPHPKTKGLTIVRLAALHQTGGPRLPARKLIVPPDARTLTQMAADMRRAVQEVHGGK